LRGGVGIVVVVVLSRVRRRRRGGSELERGEKEMSFESRRDARFLSEILVQVHLQSRIRLERCPGGGEREQDGRE